MDQARERRRAYFYHWFGKHLATITERMEMVLITDLSFSVSLFSSSLILSIELSV